MNRPMHLRARSIELALGLALALALPSSWVLPSSALPFVATLPVAAPRGHVADVTERDIAASNAKVRMAYADLSAMWSTSFTRLGERFGTPRLLRYRGAVGSACGIMRPGNAAYCPRENAVYFDEVFVAAQAKSAARELGTDGDMAGIGVIAHEVGHAVAIQLGYGSPIAYENEAVADCLAGAFARHAGRNGSRERGDVDEAFFGMAAAADPTPELTGNRRIDRRILARAAAMGHGTREQRMENFGTGLEGGAGACLEDLQGS